MLTRLKQFWNCFGLFQCFISECATTDFRVGASFVTAAGARQHSTRRRR